MIGPEIGEALTITALAMSRRRVLALLGAVTAGSLTQDLRVLYGQDGAGAATGEQIEAFLAALMRADGPAVERMLDRDATLARATDPQGRSAFVLAHLGGHPQIAALLQARGLELDVVEAVLAADWKRVEALAAAQPRS